jgi:hypothetical protein
VDDFDDHVTERQHVAIADPTEPRRRLRPSEKDILGPGRLGQVPTGRDVVRVNVGIEDIEELQPGVSCRIEVAPHVTDRIDDRSTCLPSTAKEIGDRHRVRVQKLAQDHGYLRRPGLDSGLKEFVATFIQLLSIMM